VVIGADVVTAVLGGAPRRIPSRVAGTMSLLTGALGVAIGMPNFDEGDSRTGVGIVNAVAGVGTMAIGLYRIIRADANAQKAESRVSVGPWLNGRGTAGVAGRVTF